MDCMKHSDKLINLPRDQYKIAGQLGIQQFQYSLQNSLDLTLILYKDLIIKLYSMMTLKPAIMSIALVLFINHSYSYCEGTHGLSHSSSSCLFYYNYTDPNCTDFKVSQCSFVVCRNKGKKQNCQRYETQYDLTWAGCTSRCCDPSVSYTQAYGAFKQCQSYLDYEFELGVIIGVSIGGGILLIIIIILCCIFKEGVGNCFRRIFSKIGDCCGCICVLIVVLFCCKCFRRLDNESNGQNFRGPSMDDLANNDMNVMPNNVPIANGWIRQGDINQCLKQDCCICLERGPSLQLQCGHVYHRICIIEGTKRKWECSICRCKKINKIRVYCQECFSCYFETTLKQQEGQLLNQVQCDSCKEIHIMEQKNL